MKEIEDYILSHIDEEPEELKKLNRDVHVNLLRPRMLSGHLQGRTLKMFCRMIRPERILEIGTYAGYSALSMAEALEDNGILHTIEINDELEDFILKHFNQSEHAHKIRLHIGDVFDILPDINEQFDLVFIDGDKRRYWDYFELVYEKVRPGGFILADNTLWDGKVIQEVAGNDAQTKGILEFNDRIARDKRVEKVILPLRDGMTLLYKIYQ
ncbi:MAG: O-methyltransferase [Candidatus Azobacteroides sp.]|nr:O-methyltransferase [Candidatus Azobacteroides sp.]